MYIAVCGNIGSGKTTLAHRLSEHYQWEVALESAHKNPYLQDFYEDMGRWAFHLQVYFLNNRFRQVKQIIGTGTPTVQDRTIYEDARIFATNLYRSGYMDDRDYQNYLSLFNAMLEHIAPPYLLIYLKADIPKLSHHINKRGRDYEKNIPLDYLRDLNQCYEEWTAAYDLGRLLTIDINAMDFVEYTEDFSSIVSLVDAELESFFE